jgi:Spy/CpxP family protein refolding chaperone
MTIDSLGAALNLTAAQRAKIAPSYDSLGAVMKDAATKRQAFRQQMQSGGFQPGQEPTPEMRARFDSIRTQMQEFQTEADKWIASIRNNLTPDQQTKFDALPKPQLARRGMGGGPTRP